MASMVIVTLVVFGMSDLQSDQIERLRTADGATVAVRHKPVSRGTPTVLLHGLASNGAVWDLPEVRGEGFHFRSLVSLLQESGFDVYLVNFRGHGAPDMLSTPAPDQSDWCVDHFVLYDLPAVVDYVIEQTGRKPFILGASMGAMTLAGYLQGTRLEGAGEAQRVVADAALARRRQSRLAGCVLVEFPAALRWPASAYDERGRLDWQRVLNGWWQQRSETNYPFEIAARMRWLEALIVAYGNVPFGSFRPHEDREPWYRRLPQRWQEPMAQLERGAMQTLLNVTGVFTGSKHHRAEVILAGRRFAIDDVSAGVMQQLAKCVRRGAFVSEIGTPDHVYSDHYELVELPVLVVQGGRDRIASAAVTREAFFDRISSADKTWLFDETMAHGEIQAAPAPCERLYPEIIKWLTTHECGTPTP